MSPDFDLDAFFGTDSSVSMLFRVVCANAMQNYKKESKYGILFVG